MTISAFRFFLPLLLCTGAIPVCAQDATFPHRNERTNDLAASDSIIVCITSFLKGGLSPMGANHVTVLFFDNTMKMKGVARVDSMDFNYFHDVAIRNDTVFVAGIERNAGQDSIHPEAGERCVYLYSTTGKPLKKISFGMGTSLPADMTLNGRWLSVAYTSSDSKEQRYPSVADICMYDLVSGEIQESIGRKGSKPLMLLGTEAGAVLIGECSAGEGLQEYLVRYAPDGSITEKLSSTPKGLFLGAVAGKDEIMTASFDILGAENLQPTIWLRHYDLQTLELKDEKAIRSKSWVKTSLSAYSGENCLWIVVEKKKQKRFLTAIGFDGKVLSEIPFDCNSEDEYGYPGIFIVRDDDYIFTCERDNGEVISVRKIQEEKP